MNFDQPPKLKNNKKEDVKNPEDKRKGGIDFVFEQNPELSEIGTEEQYSEYLDTIFPESKVKEIVYHGSNYKIEKFEKRVNPQNSYGKDSYKAGWFFSSSKDTAKAFIGNKYIARISNLVGLSKDKNPTIHASLLNIQNSVEEDRKGQRGIGYSQVNNAYDNGNDAYIARNVVDPYEKSDVFVIFKSEQIHILGSRWDIEKFKDFISKNKEK